MTADEVSRRRGKPQPWRAYTTPIILSDGTQGLHMMPAAAGGGVDYTERVQYGVEARALESLRRVFDQARAAMKKYPGCAQFAAIVTHMLNVDLRPVTAKWHRGLVEIV
jgi:hypothetical protein